MSVLSLIIKREFTAKVRNKAFIVMTFLSPLLFVGIGCLIAYLTSLKADRKTVAVVDQTGMFSHTFKSDDEFLFLNQTDVPLQTLRDSVMAKKYEAVLYIPKVADNAALQNNKIEYISNDSPGITFIEGLQDDIARRLTADNLVKSRLDTLAIQKAQANVSITLQKASGEQSLKGLNEIKMIIGGTFGYLIMMFIIIYGNMVMRSVIEEKTNRIIEIIISSVKPFHLMLGKIIGTSLAGVLQFIIWAAVGLILFFGASTFLGVHPATVPPGAVQAAQQHAGLLREYMAAILNLPLATMIISFIVYFIGGYFLYSSFYAAIGAAVDSETDSQQFLLPIIMPLILGVYIGFFTVINNPHGSVATAFSMIPLTSPIVMLMRIPFGVPLWQLLLSMAILFVTFLGVVWFAARIYRVGILMYGKKPTYKEIFKWLRY
jgi:ABC-2 type transport system permease protein